MLEKIGISIMFLMTIGACVAGAIGMGIGMVESFKEKDWGAAFGTLAIFLLLTLIGGLVFVLWICYLRGKGF